MANSTQNQNCFEQLAAHIPGYRGYMEKERRRDIDKLHREHLATELQRLKSPLHNLARELSECNRLLETKPIERAASKLDKIENRIRYASYGYSGFFDVVKVREAELDRIYQFDLGLVANVEAVRAKVAELASSSEAAALKAAARALEQAIDHLDAQFNQRHKAIESIANL
jgi:hypothetical protein